MASPKNLAAAQSGGPSPVIHNTLRGIVESARDLPEIGTVFGARLEARANETSDADLALALKWSRAVNAAVDEMVHGVAPFFLNGVSQWGVCR